MTEVLKHWSIGKLLMTQTTEGWTLEQKKEADDKEKCMVFSNFLSSDEGKSRQLIAIFETPEKANQVVLLHNELNTIINKYRTD